MSACRFTGMSSHIEYICVSKLVCVCKQLCDSHVSVYEQSVVFLAVLHIMSSDKEKLIYTGL